jgi:homoserine dehydrogenase
VRNIINNCCGRIPPASFKEEHRIALNILSIDDIVSMYYFRFTVIDTPGVLSKIAGILGDHKISISSVIQKGRKEGGDVSLVMLTHEAVERNVKSALQEIGRLPFISDKTVVIRVEEGT